VRGGCVAKMKKMNGLSLSNIHKSFGSKRALEGVSFEVTEGEIVAVLGPSGCGKSTLLAVIAGLEAPEVGEVRWNGQSLEGVPTHRRGFGLMFQDFALFPHLRVGENVAFGLKINTKANTKDTKVNTKGTKVNTKDTKVNTKGTKINTQDTNLNTEEHEGKGNKKTLSYFVSFVFKHSSHYNPQVVEMLELVGLPGFERRDVNTLSGGEQQRVALARSLAPHPRLLMLDEPLGSLDRALRERLITELRDILHHIHQTTIYVTHDQEEVFALADRVVVMDAGRVQQIGTPQEIYGCPTTPFVARFIGLTNLLPGIASAHGIETTIGTFPNPQGVSGLVTVLIRPEVARLSGTDGLRLEGILAEHSFRGSTCRIQVEVKGQRLAFDFPSSVDFPRVGTPLCLSLDPKRAVQLFPQ
jgi:ABC-type Fe3+/spermidine/putrescine transport system ATPase subunit